jgi:hypothetical protein
MTLAEDRAAAIAQALAIAEAMTSRPQAAGSPQLRDWTAVAPDDTSWTPRLVYASGASASLTCARGRVVIRGVCPDPGACYDWPPLKITLAVDASPERLVAHFTRRLVPGLLAAYAAVTEQLADRRRHQQAMTALHARLRDAIPAGLRDEAWPGDVNTLRLRGIGGAVHATGRIRVMGSATVDIDLDGVGPDIALAVLRVLSAGPAPEPAPEATGSRGTDQ